MLCKLHPQARLLRTVDTLERARGGDGIGPEIARAQISSPATAGEGLEAFAALIRGGRSTGNDFQLTLESVGCTQEHGESDWLPPFRY